MLIIYSTAIEFQTTNWMLLDFLFKIFFSFSTRVSVIQILKCMLQLGLRIYLLCCSVTLFMVENRTWMVWNLDLTSCQKLQVSGSKMICALVTAYAAETSSLKIVPLLSENVVNVILIMELPLFLACGEFFICIISVISSDYNDFFEVIHTC